MPKRMRMLVVGAVATVAAVGLAFGANRSGETVEFDTVSDIIASKFNALPQFTSDVVFDESKIRTFELEVTDEDWEWLNDNPILEQYVPATLTYLGYTYEAVGLRYKGSFGALRFCFDERGNQICDKLSFKLKFSEYEPSGRFYGLRRLNLHSMTSDDTNMHDALAYGMYRAAGVAAPRTAYARVVINGELIGLYAVIEEIDAEFARYAFPDAGNGTLYKEVWPEHSDAEKYEEKVVAGPSDQGDAFVRFAAALAAVEEGEFMEMLAEWTDIDAMFNYLAADRLVDHWDGFVAWYCHRGPCFNHNYYWYEEGFDDKFWLIPWDLDHTFEFPSPIRTYFRMPDWDGTQSCETVRVFLRLPGRPPGCDNFIHLLATEGWDAYVEATQRLLDGPFSVEELHARIDWLSGVISEAVAEDPNGPKFRAWEIEVEDLKRDIVSIRDRIVEKIAE